MTWACSSPLNKSVNVWKRNTKNEPKKKVRSKQCLTCAPGDKWRLPEPIKQRAGTQHPEEKSKTDAEEPTALAIVGRSHEDTPV